MSDIPLGQPLNSEDPRSIGQYSIASRLGIGGMGVVYMARSPQHELIAVKVIKPELAHQRHFRARFAREVEAMRRVRGERVAQLVDADPEADTPWLAMEYVPGPTLHDYVLEQGPLPQGAVIELAHGLAEALESIHQAGMVHRDLKPSNVILSPDGPKVLDFGIAHVMDATALTSTGQQIGSIAWMAPEQLIDGTETSATDVHAWAATLHFAATGRNPYGEGRPQALALRIANGQPNPEPIEPRLDTLIRTALAAEPGRRPSISQILDSADDTLLLLDATSVLPGPDQTIAEIPYASESYPSPADIRRNRIPKGAYAVWLVALALLATLPWTVPRAKVMAESIQNRASSDSPVGSGSSSTTGQNDVSNVQAAAEPAPPIGTTYWLDVSREEGWKLERQDSQLLSTSASPYAIGCFNGRRIGENSYEGAATHTGYMWQQTVTFAWEGSLLRMTKSSKETNPSVSRTLLTPSSQEEIDRVLREVEDFAKQIDKGAKNWCKH